MAKFDRALSGIPALDDMLDNIRLGDNVVWQVSSVEDYKVFARRFALQAISDQKKLLYIRFASHEPILEPMDGLEIHTLNPGDGFEAFTTGVHSIIARAGREAYYVFDCLSDLQVVWAADLMMGNFFQVTCPYLFELDTVAFFPVLRGRHSFDAIARIRETTQLFLDIYCEKDELFVHPIKVWNRYSATMFLPHLLSDDGLTPSADGINVGRFYSLLERDAKKQQDQNLDSWERFFMLCNLKHQLGTLTDADCETLCKMLMTREDRMSGLILEYFTPEDYFSVRNRLVGSGKVGGKACGMLLARKIIEKQPELSKYLEPHDSFFIGTDVFYTYLVQNACWKLRVKHRADPACTETNRELKQRILDGGFSEGIKEQFRRMLEYFGQSPIIVRSSSFLEDGFGNAFAGKYDSVFCSNMGSLDQRMEAFENAVRQVYASTMDESALEYRRVKGLEHNDEQMAVLVQRVSGMRMGSYFFPNGAGVGYSYNSYRFNEAIDPEAGMLRLVMGLGTRAVDRTEGDYPRIICLDKPGITSAATAAERNRFSQRNIDVIDLENNCFTTKKISDIEAVIPQWYRRLAFEHDTDAESMFAERGEHKSIEFISCRGMAEHKGFISVMNGMIDTISKAYDYPVDIEFTVNFNAKAEFMVNLVQCRPLQIIRGDGACAMPSMDESRMLFDIYDSSMGIPQTLKLDTIVFVDPIAYYEYPYAKKPLVVSAISEINAQYRKNGKRAMLMVPGRIGTSSPELGVPTSFADVNAFSVICEMSESRAGYMPELSYGSHMFQDLVEANILYTAIFMTEKTKVFEPELLYKQRDTADSFPKTRQFGDMIRVYDFSREPITISMDIGSRRTVCGFTLK